MYEVVEGIAIGDASECSPAWFGPILHAARHPCWMNAREAVTRGMRIERIADGVIVVPNGMYLSMVDGPTPELFKVDTFRQCFTWLSAHLDKGPLVHCNRGGSRAPAIAMAYLARLGRLGTLAQSDFAYAHTDFLKHYPSLHLGPGILAFLVANWDALMEVKAAS